MSSSSPPSSFSGAGSAEWAGSPGAPPAARAAAAAAAAASVSGANVTRFMEAKTSFAEAFSPGKVALLVDPEPRAILVHDAEEPVVRVIQALRALQAQHQGPEEARAVHPLLGLRCRRFLVRPWGCPPQLGPQGLQPLSELL